MALDDTVPHDSFFIDGDWRRATEPDSRVAVVESRSGTTMAQVAAASREDVDDAVRAAARAFPSWRATSLDERLGYLSALAGVLDTRADDLATLEAREIGTPITATRRFHVAAATTYLRSLARYARAAEWELQLVGSRAVRVPVGVTGVITPWNNPLLLTAMKAGSALAAGCTVVMKVSELAPLGLLQFADAAREVGLPHGVLNVLSGYGPVAGEALVTHPGVAKVSFTGSVAAARRVAALAGQNLTPVTLELGGKSASILLDDADFEHAIQTSIASSFHHNGQYCLATTRVLVPRSRLGEAEELALAAAEQWNVGDPLDVSTRLGPVISAAQQDRAREYIRAGVQEGARLLLGGPEPPGGFEDGFYVKPTLFSDATNQMTVARAELFGPIQTLIAYDDGDERAAIEIANDSEYGLGGAVWSADATRAERVALAIDTGNIEINGGPLDFDAPCGGFKNSGFGRESGRVGVEDFLTWKSLHGSRPAAA
jgi:aldehyde dehydrogenase (NAD+)